MLSVFFSITSSGLLKACFCGNVEVVSLLLERGADINWRDKWGDTCLIKASRGGFKAIVRLLLSHKQCDLDAKNKDGEDALLAAARQGHMQVAEMLIAAGATVTKEHTEHLCFSGHFAI